MCGQCRKDSHQLRERQALLVGFHADEEGSNGLESRADARHVGQRQDSGVDWKKIHGVLPHQLSTREGGRTQVEPPDAFHKEKEEKDTLTAGA